MGFSKFLYMAGIMAANCIDTEKFYSGDVTYRRNNGRKIQEKKRMRSYSRKQLEVLGGGVSRRPLREFKVKGQTVMARSRKDALKQLERSKRKIKEGAQ